MKTMFYSVVAICLLGAFSIAAVHCENSASPKTEQAASKKFKAEKKINNSKALDKDSIPSDWKTYANKELGIRFQVPPTWIKYGKESNAVNRDGAVMVRMVNFIDTVSKSVFYLEYHVAPYGAELYKYDKAQIDSLKGATKKEAKQISIAGNKVTETFSTMSSDIKGNIYNPPLKFVNIFFLDKRQTGEFNLHFRTFLPISETEISRFNRVLSTIKFIN
jgi:hypothetical protein